MFSQLLHFFSYEFVREAFAVGIMISLCASVLGVSLVLRRCSMIGDGLSHVSFGAMTAASAMGIPPLILSVPVVSLSAIGLLRMRGTSKTQGDAAIGATAAVSLAIGTVIASVTGQNSELAGYMFGSLNSISGSDVIISIVASILIIGCCIVFHNKIFAVVFDEPFVSAIGVKSSFYDLALAIITAITVVLGMRMTGALLISALMILPALSSMQLFKNFRSVTVGAAIIGVTCSVLGLSLSCLYSIPTGAGIVIFNALAYAVCRISAYFARKIPQKKYSEKKENDPS